MTSALFNSVVCRGNSTTANDWNRNNKFIIKVGPVVALTPDSSEKRKVQTILQLEGHLFRVFCSSNSRSLEHGTTKEVICAHKCELWVVFLT